MYLVLNGVKFGDWTIQMLHQEQPYSVMLISLNLESFCNFYFGIFLISMGGSTKMHRALNPHPSHWTYVRQPSMFSGAPSWLLEPVTLYRRRNNLL